MSALSDIEVELRQHYVCGSDAGRIMVGQWRDLWAEKTGRSAPKPLWERLDPVADRFLLRRMTAEQMDVKALMGHALEPLNRTIFESRTGRTVSEVQRWVETDGYGFPMGATLDGRTSTAAGQEAVWDAKFAGRADDAATIRNTPQMTHNALARGVEHWVLSYLVGNGKWFVEEQEVDPLYAADLIATERKFWGYVERDEEPPDMTPVTAPKPARPIRRIELPTIQYDEHGAETAEWQRVTRLYNWASEAGNWIETFAGTEQAHKAHMAARSQIAKVVPDDIGELRRGRFLFKRNRLGAIMMKTETG